MMTPLKTVKISTSQLDELFQLLQKANFTLIGPTLKGQAITYDTLTSIHDLPKGWSDEQEKGHYRLKKRKDNALFGYNLGSRTFKQFLFPPREKLIHLQPNQSKPIQVTQAPKQALIGVRACELAAIEIQDKVFNSENFPDPRYQQRRQNTFIMSLNCHTTVKTCFCVSMKTGPEVTQKFDINMSEMIDDKSHYFICEAGSEQGLAFLEKIDGAPLTSDDIARKNAMIQKTSSQMGRTLDTHGIKERLYQAHDHPHWDNIAQKCINCANCTLACPTCFCSKIEDDSNLEQTNATRTKVWDSCFSVEHSYIHGSHIRESATSRYRQWMTHKLASWQDQFDTSGCVGCGRCITWCPVGIDITEEILNFSDDEINHEKDQ